MKPRVLLVDDDTVFCDDLVFHLGDRFEWLTRPSTEGILRTIVEHLPDVVLLDIEFAGRMDGFEALERIRDEAPRVPVIMVTRHDPQQLAAEAWRRGAFGYIEKVSPMAQVLVQIERAVEEATAHRERQVLREELQERAGRLVGESKPMTELKRSIRRAAESDSTVLITGETGTGKELIAREIHMLSPRRDHLFVTVSCAAIPQELFESELFGHERGAFTGAHTRRIGKFEAANGGTIYLDEIGELPLSVQAKLLRTLQRSEDDGRYRIQRLGSNLDIPVDVRVIAATNRNMESLVREENFRDDLYFRLRVVHLRAPALREIKEDIPLLAHHLLDRLPREVKRPRCRLTSRALGRLMKHNWKGNVREMKHSLERAMVYADGDVLDEPLFADLAESAALKPACSGSLREAVVQFIREFVILALRECSWNVSEAARRLGISREGLRKLMRRHSISRPDDPQAQDEGA